MIDFITEVTSLLLSFSVCLVGLLYISFSTMRIVSKWRSRKGGGA